MAEGFEFLWWWAFFLLPLPFLAYHWLPQVSNKNTLRLAYLPKEIEAAGVKNKFSKLVTLLIWCSLIVASARPVWFGEPIEHFPEYRDLMLVVDLSGSMQQEDILQEGDYIDRLSAVKNVVTQFIEQRQGDRLGLVLFADHAYLQTPLTADRQTVANQLNQTIIGLFGQKTAIGDGLALATKTFVDSEAPQRVVILLSDGSNTAGTLDPIEAANIAKKYGVKIYTIGIGAGEMEVKQFFMTRKVNTSADLDEKTLTKIATMTGGQYFRARDAQELQTIYHAINQLEPVSKDAQVWRPQQEWFVYPLSFAFVLSILLFVLRRNHV
ncbi:VWA domain-containing protein [Vibrio vulnificus]|nr:VWA domain-containing protein [Vibrio vulnificus]EHT4877194.1 VWA domain-containing protein [Vibrio vulnificus]EHU4801881.1 VWA domain-containing protein [Vibrio vulnificus]EHZ2497030.1 VWA domain-containing protein [Vibrio vulnificus]EIA0806325.1 VWA domain-containing protein [Vibrio vulnificus]